MLVRLLQQRYFRWCLAIFSGILMVISFPYTGSAFPLAFVAWIPLLLLESTYANRRSFNLLPQAYITFLIYNADPDGAYMAFICNSLLMTLVFYLFHRIKKRMGNHWTAPILISVWISFEFLHFNWELSWPWLTLGNVFADVPALVQWYSWTGVFGGTLWVLMINLMLYRLIRKIYIDREQRGSLRPFLIQIAAFLLIPVLISLVLYTTYSEVKKPYEVVVIQPNIDPYN